MANKKLAKEISKDQMARNKKLADVPSNFAGMFAQEWKKAGGSTKSYKDKDGTEVTEITGSPKKKK